jgi:hypothetical protein
MTQSERDKLLKRRRAELIMLGLCVGLAVSFIVTANMIGVGETFFTAEMELVPVDQERADRILKYKFLGYMFMIISGLYGYSLLNAQERLQLEKSKKPEKSQASDSTHSSSD